MNSTTNFELNNEEEIKDLIENKIEYITDDDDTEAEDYEGYIILKTKIKDNNKQMRDFTKQLEENEEYIRLNQQIKLITAQLDTMKNKINPLFKLSRSLDRKLDIYKYVNECIKALKKALSIDDDEDKDILNNIRNELLLHITSLPVTDVRYEEGKYYDPYWKVYSIEYGWDYKEVAYDYWYLWCKENKSHEKLYTDDKVDYYPNIRRIYSNIIEYKNYYMLKELDIKYIPILVAYIRNELDTL